jgi:hypothetical protein
MHGTYLTNKASATRWRIKNKDKHREYSVKSMRKIRAWKSIRTEFLNILVDNI